jgi:hypothetical protein
MTDTHTAPHITRTHRLVEIISTMTVGADSQRVVSNATGATGLVRLLLVREHMREREAERRLAADPNHVYWVWYEIVSDDQDGL